MASHACQQLIELGFAGPVPALSAGECRRFLAVARDPRRRPPLDWPKGQAVHSRPFYEVATHPAVLAVVEEMLGGDVMLWGASVITQRPGGRHPWHSDIETSGPTGKTVSVWIGLENIDATTSLQFISYSYRFGATVQEVRKAEGKARDEATTENIVAWAKARDPRAELVRPRMTTGDALFFQGQAWHHTENSGNEARQALLLQYATPATPVRLPDFNTLDWPFKLREVPKPACVMIRGSDNSGGVNRIVPGPAAGTTFGRIQLSNTIYPLAAPFAAENPAGFRSCAMFRGATADVAEMEVHASMLNQGQTPHPPHAHAEEEILILLSGEADLLLPAVKGPAGDDRHPLRPGEFVYYPAHFPHTLRGTSAEPATYLMFKWHAEPTKAASPLGFGRFNALDPNAEKAGEGWRTRVLFEGPTGCLRRLHAHVSLLEPGAGYEPHADAYDVAIIVLEGEVETLGQRVAPFGTIFHPAGEPHGIRNPAATPARYLVFEFHGSQAARSEAFATNEPTPLWQKALDPNRWKSKLKRIAKRLIKR